MITILQQTGTHTLALEKTAGQWWLELINRASGATRIITFGRKDKAQAFFARTPMDQVIRIYDGLNVKETPMYKAGVM